MKIITIANQKGGTGKTTIAVNLAVCALRDGLKAVVVNADVQPSALNFAMVRSQKGVQPTLPVANIINDHIHRDVQKYKKADIVIIDAGGRDSRALRSAIAAAHVLVIPTLPGPFDIWASEATILIAEKIREVKYGKMKIFALLNNLVSRAVITGEARKALDILKVKRLSTELFSRTAYKKSVMEGKSVIEYTDRRAAKEMAALWEELCAWI